MAHDPYQTLGLSVAATDEQVKSAWKQAARDTHPDLHPNDPTANRRFSEAKEAYDLLSDPYRRGMLDRERTLRQQYGEPGPGPKPTREHDRAPGWWNDIFGPRPSVNEPVRVRPSSPFNPYYYQEQRDLEADLGAVFAWNRRGVYTGTAERRRNTFRTKFRNGGKVG